MLGYGPLVRKERPGVPQDRFVKAGHNDPSRFMAVDHRGRVTALIAEGSDTLVDPALEELAVLSDDDRRAVAEWGLAVGLANAVAWLMAEQGLNEVDARQHAGSITGDDLLGLFANGVNAEALADTPFHGKTSTEHSHQHSAYGTQGSDSTHSHSHKHSGDATHSHHAAASTTTVTPMSSGAELAAKIAHLRERQASTPDVPRMAVKVMTASGEVDVDMAVRWDDEAWDPYKWDAALGRYGAKGCFVSTLPRSDNFAMVAAGADLPQIVSNPGAAWHAILCVEGLRTDEDPGREIMAGACRFPDLPVSLRLQIHDEGGHYGAVTCGRIDEMDRLDMQGYNAISGAGVFGTDEHGQTGQLLVDEQTQRFISIDPRDVTMEVVEIEISTSGYYDYDEPEPDLYDWWVRYTDLVIGAATIVATPALPQSVICLANVELPETPIAVANAPTSTITASAGSEVPLPPVEMFQDPGFKLGDPRLVRQANGKYACPLQVSKPDANGWRRVFGHAAAWHAHHTGMPGQKRTPPHSPTYAYFMTGARMTAEGVKVPVGNLTMGTGHASTAIRDAARAKAHYASTTPPPAHYDGGFGAIQMADVAAGEDEFGIWVSGVICENVDELAIRRFESLGLSGDWREIAGALHMVACLAVPVPGFPIAREDALVASAEVIELHAVRAGMDDAGEVYALVAAGRVRSIPVDERFATLEGQLDMLLRERNERLMAEARGSLAALVS
jgi:hypothetical protein